MEESEQDEQPAEDADGVENRIGLGIAFGTLAGVVLSVLADNWGLIGVGIALGVAVGAATSSRGRKSDPDDTDA